MYSQLTSSTIDRIKSHFLSGRKLKIENWRRPMLLLKYEGTFPHIFLLVNNLYTWLLKWAECILQQLVLEVSINDYDFLPPQKERNMFDDSPEKRIIFFGYEAAVSFGWIWNMQIFFEYWSIFVHKSGCTYLLVLIIRGRSLENHLCDRCFEFLSTSLQENEQEIMLRCKRLFFEISFRRRGGESVATNITCSAVSFLRQTVTSSMKSLDGMQFSIRLISGVTIRAFVFCFFRWMEWRIVLWFLCRWIPTFCYIHLASVSISTQWCIE